MSSGYGKSNGKAGSINAFDFDLGLGSGRKQSMKDLKNQTSSHASATTTFAYSSAQQKTNASTTATWSHQSVQSGMKGSLSGQTSMVGDIFGKTWNSSASSNSLGVLDAKNPNLFGDLLTSAMGVNRSSSNLPLKSVAPNTFSMGSVASSLPKNSYSVKSSGTFGDGISNASSSSRSNSGIGGANLNLGGNSTGNQNLGGASMRSMAGKGSAKDPFGGLVDFGPKIPSKETGKKNHGADVFGEFQNPTPNISVSSTPPQDADPFDGFGFSSASSGNHTQPSNQQPSTMGSEFDTLFSSTAGNVAAVSDADDWGMNSEFHGGNDTTELEGLPPPPAGVSAHSAMSKGTDSYKKGQFADAIKWLSWAVLLFEKTRDVNGCMEVLTCRASCYKEVGEYKKAVADCTKVLEHDGKNVAVLVQRALLYESMEKYKLGAEDLRTVMKLDPGNRVARSTIHRLVKMAE